MLSSRPLLLSLALAAVVAFVIAADAPPKMEVHEFHEQKNATNGTQSGIAKWFEGVKENVVKTWNNVKENFEHSIGHNHNSTGGNHSLTEDFVIVRMERPTNETDGKGDLFNRTGSHEDSSEEEDEKKDQAHSHEH